MDDEWKKKLLKTGGVAQGTPTVRKSSVEEALLMAIGAAGAASVLGQLGKGAYRSKARDERTAAKKKRLAKKAATLATRRRPHRAACVQPSPDLPLFSTDSICAKCHCADITTIWRDGSDYKPLSSKEHLERVCKQCQYKWAERPMDKAHDLELLARESDE